MAVFDIEGSWAAPSSYHAWWTRDGRATACFPPHLSGTAIVIIWAVDDPGSCVGGGNRKCGNSGHRNKTSYSGTRAKHLPFPLSRPVGEPDEMKEAAN